MSEIEQKDITPTILTLLESFRVRVEALPKEASDALPIISDLIEVIANYHEQQNELRAEIIKQDKIIINVDKTMKSIFRRYPSIEDEVKGKPTIEAILGDINETKSKPRKFDS